MSENTPIPDALWGYRAKRGRHPVVHAYRFGTPRISSRLGDTCVRKSLCGKSLEDCKKTFEEITCVSCRNRLMYGD